MHGYEIRATQATESKRAAYYDRRTKTKYVGDFGPNGMGDDVMTMGDDGGDDDANDDSVS